MKRLEYLIKKRRDQVLLNQETGILVRKLLAEVSEMRKENQQLRTEVANLKTTATWKKLFESSKDNDP